MAIENYNSLLPPKFLSKDLKNRTVILRADLNITFNKKPDLFKLKSILPTLDALIEKKAKIVLITHIGRPKFNKIGLVDSKSKKELSTKPLAKILTELGYKTFFAKDLDQVILLLENNSIVLLENIRFWQEETAQEILQNKAQKLNLDKSKSNRPKNISVNSEKQKLFSLNNQQEDLENNLAKAEEFAQKFFKLADYYICDAWGAVHRRDTSLTILPKLFSPENKSVGLLVAKEITELSKLKESEQKPIVLLLGGAKIRTKLPLILPLLDWADSILLSPMLSYPFDIIKNNFKANLENINLNFVDINLAEKILIKAKDLNKKLVIPEDYQVKILDNNNLNKNNLDNNIKNYWQTNLGKNYQDNNFFKDKISLDNNLGENNLEELNSDKIFIGLSADKQKQDKYFFKCSLNTEDKNNIAKNCSITTIGSNTVKIYSNILDKAGTIFINGISGFEEEPETMLAYKALLQTVAQLSSYKVIGGGDSVAAVHKYGLEKTINFCSTGGGSTMAYLADQDLPALDALF